MIIVVITEIIIIDGDRVGGGDEAKQLWIVSVTCWDSTLLGEPLFFTDRIFFFMANYGIYTCVI